MADALDNAVSWLNAQGQDALAADLARLEDEHESAGYPALHHSATYREAYKPAYRVVLSDIAAQRGWCEEKLP